MPLQIVTAKIFEIPAQFIIEVDSLFDLGNVEIGVIFLGAEWSPFCRIVLTRLKGILPKLIEEHQMDFYVMDCTEVEGSIQTINDYLDGSGAITLWVKQGEIIARINGNGGHEWAKFDTEAKRLTALLLN